MGHCSLSSLARWSSLREKSQFGHPASVCAVPCFIAHIPPLACLRAWSAWSRTPHFVCTTMTPRRSARLAATPTPRAPPTSRSRSRGAPSSHNQRNEQAPSFEFCGPLLGPVGMLFGLPAVCYSLLATCNASGCMASVRDLVRPATWPGLPAAGGLVSGAGFVAVFALFFAQAVIHVVLPGTRRKGVVLASGKRLEYKLTGERVVFVCGEDGKKQERASECSPHRLHPQAPPTSPSPWPPPPPPSPRPVPREPPPPLAWAYDNYAALLTAAVTLSTLLSVGLYAASFRPSLPPSSLAPHGATGWRLYDFFMGRELNPRALGARWPRSLRLFDWKEFCELYPGLLGWLVLDLACAAKQFERVRIGGMGGGGGGGRERGGQKKHALLIDSTTHPFPQTGTISPAMALVCAFHAVYVSDALAHEPSILTTMDITTDGFGFMLAFGDLAWVPFTYSLQARYLADHESVSVGKRGGGGRETN